MSKSMFLFATQVRAETPARIPVPIQKEWTVLFYFNGKSELETYAIKNFKELETIGSSDNVNFVAELGRMRKQQADDYSNGDWTGIRRYYIEKKPGRLIGSPALETTTKVDMGDWRHLRDFINWGMVHAHITVSSPDGKVTGGHLMAGATVHACEVFVQELVGNPKCRKSDKATGLPLWTNNHD